MHRLSLINLRVCPPDGFRYVFPETGYLSHAWDHDTWVQQAKNHLNANNRETPPDLVAIMEDQLCQLLPPGWCNYDDPNRVRPGLAMSWDDVKHGVATMSAWVGDGAHYVPQAEAERRAEICSRCYLNLPVEGCSACHAAVQLITRNKSTKHDNYLKACGVCKCLLKAKVFFPQHTLEKQNARLQEMYPSFCWNRKDGENYRQT